MGTESTNNQEQDEHKIKNIVSDSGRRDED